MDRSARVEQLIAAVHLSRLPGVGAKSFKELISKHGDPARALSSVPEQLALGDTGHKAAPDPEQLEGLRQLPRSIDFTILGAPDYPWLLAQTPEPPPYMFRRGPLWPLPAQAVAIVGSRKSSSAGERFAHTLARRLASLGVMIASGGARGIDRAAHAGALGVSGATALVTATGIDRYYPRENEDLYRQVWSSGCALTELLPATPPRRDFFPTRNRILVGLSDATIIVEGTQKSGTFSSANHAAKLGRQILVWTGSPDEELRQLPVELARRGAGVLATTDPEPVMHVLKAYGQGRRQS